ncbi:hypothetical protein CTI12_AA142720 [Artemisia annua]|uniref:KIB1-4 beta-propeller domain-containing protein n=1 Tax=Artemisia annua TaxID=35608 RepID=A0A2U1PKB1_ARTAN|nr:hypothetical protein CTI12_AA142720 [Artemisia annua]
MGQKHKEMSCHSLVPPLSPKYPWFVAQNLEAEDDDTQGQIFYNLHDPMSHYRCQIPELLGKRIRGCFHGCWVLLSSNRPRDVMWSLWNPITSKIINLPPLNRNGSSGDNDYIGYYCLSAPPEHLNSVLLLTRADKPNFVYCRLGRRKDIRWTESTYAKQVRIITGCDGLLHSLTCCNGKVYAFISDSIHRNLLLVEVKIVVNDRKRKKLGEVVITLLPILEIPCPNFIGCFNISMTMKGSCTELFIIVIGLKDKRQTVVVVTVFKLDKNNMTWEEVEDLSDTILYVNLARNSAPFDSPAISSSEFGGYIHILPDNRKIIYSYHVKDKSLSSMPYLAGTNHVSVWAMLECTGLEGDRFHVDCKQEKEGDKEDQIVIRSVKGNHDVESDLLGYPFLVLKMKEYCAGVEQLKLSPLPYSGYEYRLETDDADSKQENDKVVDVIVRSAKGDEDESHLLNLPLHVLSMVMEFSVGVEYLKFRSTCKRCHLAAPLIPWNNGKASKRLQEYSSLSPWLIVFDRHKGIITFMDPLFGDKYFIKTPQELICDFLIKCSRYGWLLILKPDRSLVLFNPFTSDIRELPQLPNYLDICSFSAPATSPDCMVVGITIHMQYYHVCIHLVGGEPSWRKILLDVSGGEMFNSLTFCGRDLYALRDDGLLDIFEEIGREGHSWVRNVAQAPTSWGASSPESFQVRCEQHLLRVIMGRFGESIEVFELNDYTREWVKINGLGKHTIFICGTSSVCMDAKTLQMENKIYFLRLPIVYYSLETCRFHTFDNTNIHDSFEDLIGTKHHLAPHGWIEPSWL